MLRHDRQGNIADFFPLVFKAQRPYALAAAIFNDPKRVEFKPFNAKERFAALQSGGIDVLSRNTTWTLTWDARYGFHFGPILFYDGQGLMVATELGFKLGGASARWVPQPKTLHSFQDAKICVLAQKTTLKTPSNHVILVTLLSKEPLASVVRQRDDQWYDIIKWVAFGLIQAEEYGISADNLDSVLTTQDPALRRFLGLDGELGSGLGLSADFMVA